MVVGDLHIPQKVAAVPELFAQLLVPGKLQYVLCTGNIGNSESKQWLESLAPDKHAFVTVSGDCDPVLPLAELQDGDAPDRNVVTIGAWKVGMIHGHQLQPWGDLESLGVVQRELDCDVLVSGHTHTLGLRTIDDKYFLNPGSLTGAPGLTTMYVGLRER